MDHRLCHVNMKYMFIALFVCRVFYSYYGAYDFIPSHASSQSLTSHPLQQGIRKDYY